jgi:hypothetical protein
MMMGTPSSSKLSVTAINAGSISNGKMFIPSALSRVWKRMSNRIEFFYKWYLTNKGECAIMNTENKEGDFSNG